MLPCPHRRQRRSGILKNPDGCLPLPAPRNHHPGGGGGAGCFREAKAGRTGGQLHPCGGADRPEPEGGKRPAPARHPGGGRLPPPDHCHHPGGGAAESGPWIRLHGHRPAVRGDAPIHPGSGKAAPGEPMGQGDGGGESAADFQKPDPAQLRPGGERGG